MDNYLYLWRIPFLEIIIWVSLYYHSLIAMGFMSEFSQTRVETIWGDEPVLNMSASPCHRHGCSINLVLGGVSNPKMG